MTDQQKSVLEVMQEVFPRKELEDMSITEDKPFGVMDQASASWAVGKIAMWQNEVERRKAQAREYVQDAERMLERMMYVFEHHLKAWAKDELADGKKKSIKLPGGTVGFRKTKDRIDIDDQDKVIAWADENGVEGAYKVRVQVMKEGLNEWHEKTGDCPAGCTIVKGVNRFYVKSV